MMIALGAASCKKDDVYYFGDRVFTLSVDVASIKDVPANNPGQVVIVVTTDAPWWVVTTPDWIRSSVVTKPGSEKGGILTLDIESNYRNMSTTTSPRSGEIKIAGGRTYVTIPVNQLGHEGWVDPNSVIGGIPDMNEFKDFITAVNDGEAPVRWMNAEGEVELQTDIDLAGFGEWTPIGYVLSSGNANNATAPKGEPFTYVFNGGGHTISNFKASAELKAGETWGFFGYLDGATVKDLKFANVDVTVSATGAADAGVVAGTVSRSTIENVNVTGTVKSAGSSVAQRFAIGGIAGFAFSVYDSGTSYDCIIRNCETTLLAEVDCGANTGNGATGVMYGGIAAFCTGVKETPSRVRVENCTSKGSMTMNVGRSSGIVPTAHYGTILSGCTNEASQLNTFENARIGQICCNLNLNSALIDCVNRGDLVTTDPKTTAAALVALMNDESVYIEGGERVANTANIIGAYTKYLSLLCANNSAFDHISGVVLSGKLGRYSADGNHKWYSVDNGNIMQYIGYIKPDYATRITGISYTGDGGGGDSFIGGDIGDLSPVDDVWHRDDAGGGVDDLNPVNDTWN